VHKNISSRQFELPFHETVMTAFGGFQSLNMCMLGAVVRLIPIVSPNSIRQVVSDHFSDRFRETNLAAVELGLGLVSESVRTF